MEQRLGCLLLRPAAAPAVCRPAQQALASSSAAAPCSRSTRVVGCSHGVSLRLPAAMAKPSWASSEGASERLHAFGKTITDTFAAKATATIYKRTRCYWRFFTWCRAVQAGNGLRLAEKVVHRYLSYLQEEGAGATSGDAFLQSLRFFHASWGFVGLNLDQELSARVSGVAHACAVLQQARALSVAELAALEDIVLGTEASHVGVDAGYLLFRASVLPLF